MINLQDLVPKVYSNQSRDFQLIERLYDTVLNSVKTNSDLIYSCPLSQNSDSRLMDLISLTLGFSSKHNYNIKQLTALCNAFTYVIKNKGNIEGLRAACNAVISAEGLDQPVEIELSKDNLELTLYIPQDLSDINLLKDLLTYILPAGMSCNIVKELLITKPTTTIIATTDTITKYYKKEDQEASMFGINTLENISDHFKSTYNSGNIVGSIANNVITHVNHPSIVKFNSSSITHKGTAQTEDIEIFYDVRNEILNDTVGTPWWGKSYLIPIAVLPIQEIPIAARNYPEDEIKFKGKFILSLDRIKEAGNTDLTIYIINRECDGSTTTPMFLNGSITIKYQA